MVSRRLGVLVAVAALVVGACGGDDEHVHAPTGATAAAAIAAQGRPDVVFAGPQGRDPQFLVRCEVSHRAPDDPIVHPGRPGASHEHVFFGNRQVTATSTYDELLGAPSSCEQPLDTASYWVPALLRDGQVVEPVGSIAYYRPAVGVDARELVPYPPGLMMLAGDPGADGPQPVEVVAWACGAGLVRSPEPPACPESAPLRQNLTFPDCWDGERLDSPNHREHVVYSSGGRCPATHPVPMPQLTFSVLYALTGDPSGILLASGAPHTLHGDFWNVWDQDKLTREVEVCLHRLAVCDVAS